MNASCAFILKVLKGVVRRFLNFYLKICFFYAKKTRMKGGKGYAIYIWKRTIWHRPNEEEVS